MSASRYAALITRCWQHHDGNYQLTQPMKWPNSTKSNRKLSRRPVASGADQWISRILFCTHPHPRRQEVFGKKSGTWSSPGPHRNTQAWGQTRATICHYLSIHIQIVNILSCHIIYKAITSILKIPTRISRIQKIKYHPTIHYWVTRVNNISITRHFVLSVQLLWLIPPQWRMKKGTLEFTRT